MTEAISHFPPVEIHSIRSRHVAQTFRIQVMLPMQMRGETTRFPVVYATEANRTFDMFMGISRIMQVSAHVTPRFILVGIGYPSDSPRAGAVLRGRDLAFPGYPKFDMSPPPAEGVLIAEPGTKHLEGGEDFQRFIGEELAPFIDEQYATVTGDRTYFGHSLGGGFGLYTLFTKPELFKRYIVSSPGLGFHGETTAGICYEHYDFLFEQARKFIASAPALQDARLYMSVGAEEEFEPGLEAWQLTSTFSRMASLLKAAAVPGLQLTTETLRGETHMTAWPIAFIHGVRAAFGARLAAR